MSTSSSIPTPHSLLQYLNTALNLTTRIPWTTLFSPLTYLLAPVVTFTSILLTFTLLKPYHFLFWLLDVLFPVYVFCGVACITGGILGFGGRIVSLGIIRAVSEENGRHEKGKTPVKAADDSETLERSAKRRKLDRKQKEGRVKFENP